MNKDFSILDGEVVNFEVLPANQSVGAKIKEDFDFSSAEGITIREVLLGNTTDPYAKFDELPSWNDDYSNLFGLGKSKEERRADRDARRQRRADRKEARQERRDERRERRADRKEARQERRDERREQRTDRREARQYRKNIRAEGKAARDTAQLEIAKSAGQSDIAIADALRSAGGAVTQGLRTQGRSGMSTAAKIGIAVGVLAVVGAGIYFITKKKK